jgi:hypothetical protein
MSYTDKLMQRFLMKLNSVEVQEAFELLEMLLEHLETKNDPEPFEMHIVDNANQTIEKLALIENILKTRVGGLQSGSKLQNLYDKNDSKIIFD